MLKSTKTSNKPASSSSTSSSTSATVPVEDIQGPRITEIEEEETEKKLDIDAKYWIVMLYANWSVSCLNFEAVLAKLSIQYDLPHLKFGKELDLQHRLLELFI